MKKKFLFVAGVASTLLLGVVAVAAGTSSARVASVNGDSSEAPYTLNVNAAAVKGGTATGFTVETAGKANIDFAYDNASMDATGFNVAAGGYVKNVTPISGTYTVTASTAAKTKLVLSYGWDETCSEGEVQLNATNNYSYTLLSKPSYVKVAATEDCKVTNLKLDYACAATEAPAVYKSHGRVSHQSGTNWAQAYSKDRQGGRQMNLGEQYTVEANLKTETLVTDETNGSYLVDPTRGNNANKDWCNYLKIYGCKTGETAHGLLFDLAIGSWGYGCYFKAEANSLFTNKIDTNINEHTFTSLNKENGLSVLLEKRMVNGGAYIAVYLKTADNYVEFLGGRTCSSDFDIRFMDLVSYQGNTPEAYRKPITAEVKIHDKKRALELVSASAKHVISGRHAEWLKSQDKWENSQIFSLNNHSTKDGNKDGVIQGDFSFAQRLMLSAPGEGNQEMVGHKIALWGRDVGDKNNGCDYVLNVFCWGTTWRVKVQDFNDPDATVKANNTAKNKEATLNANDVADLQNGNFVVYVERKGLTVSFAYETAHTAKKTFASTAVSKAGGIGWADSGFYNGTKPNLARYYAATVECENF